MVYCSAAMLEFRYCDGFATPVVFFPNPDELYLAQRLTVGVAKRRAPDSTGRTPVVLYLEGFDIDGFDPCVADALPEVSNGVSARHNIAPRGQNLPILGIEVGYPIGISTGKNAPSRRVFAEGLYLRVSLAPPANAPYPTCRVTSHVSQQALVPFTTYTLLTVITPRRWFGWLLADCWLCSQGIEDAFSSPVSTRVTTSRHLLRYRTKRSLSRRG